MTRGLCAACRRPCLSLAVGPHAVWWHEHRPCMSTAARFVALAPRFDPRLEETA